jgi:limonene-1,2-epoxide hydrolase
MDKEISKESSFEVSSHVVALQIGDSICGFKICSSYEIEEGEIKMVFPQFESRLDGETKCSYWNMSQEQWATDGVSVVERNDTHITCTTTHLTNFATVHVIIFKFTFIEFF